jgi:hypothetical protein
VKGRKLWVVLQDSIFNWREHDCVYIEIFGGDVDAPNFGFSFGYMQATSTIPVVPRRFGPFLLQTFRHLSCNLSF